MNVDRHSVTDSFSSAVSSETSWTVNLDLDYAADLDVEEDIDPFHLNLDVLKARLALAEAKEAEMPGEAQRLNVLKARKALVEAKQKVEQNQTTHQGSGAPQVVAASRMVQSKNTDHPLAKVLQFSSSIFAVTGGVLLSSNTSVSKYGFLILACSSSQIFLSSLILKQKSLMIYGASLFFLVDCLGIYRWLMQS